MAGRIGAALTLLSACSFRTSVPSGDVITCGSGDSCPQGYTCRPSLGLCVANAELQGAPGGLEQPAVTPAIGNPSTTFTLTFSLTRALAKTPVAYATVFTLAGGGGQVTTYPFVCSACSNLGPCTCTYRPDPANLPAAGPLQAYVSIVDDVGNAPPPIEAGVFDFDPTLPTLLPPTQLTITAGPGVTTPVTAVGPEGGAQVCFTASKALALSPTVWAAAASTAPAEIPFTMQSAVGEAYCYGFQRTAGDGFPDGPRGVYATAQDQAGNIAQLTVLDLDGGLVLLATPPAPPDLSSDGGLRYLRAPWGELPDSPGEPRFTVSAVGDAIPQPGWLVASADPEGAIELGRAAVSGGPLPELVLVPEDRPEAWVNLFNAAGIGLSGGAVRIRQVDWVASAGSVPVSEGASNPNACFARPAAGPTLFEPDDAVTQIAAALGDGGIAVSGAGTWRERLPGQPPLDAAGFAYDSAHGLLIAYTTDIFALLDYDGVDWAPPTGELAAPTIRYNAGLDFDQQRGRLVFFGGNDAFTYDALCDTWEWDGSNWSPRASCSGSAAATNPAPRSFGCMAYDPVRSQSVLVSGQYGDAGWAPDQWAWNGTAWSSLPTSIADAGVVGGFACAAANMAFLDGDGGELVAVAAPSPGGLPLSSEQSTVIGRWTGQTYAWTDAHLPLSVSAAQLLLAEDPIRGELGLLDCEYNKDGITQDCTLSGWDGVDPSGWTSRASLLGLPEANYVALAPAPDEDPDRPFLVVSTACNTYCDADFVTQSWECGLHGAGCRPAHHTAPSPGLDAYSGPAFDPTGHALVGASSPWLWDGSDWNALPAGLPSRIASAVGYQPADGRFWIFGGDDYDAGLGPFADLWAFSLDGGWTELTPDAGLARAGDALVYVPDAGLDGALISLGADTEPAVELTVDAGVGHAVALGGAPFGSPAYDLVRDVMVMACGPDDGFYESPAPFAHWTSLVAGLRDSCGDTWDPATQQLLVIGGNPTNQAAVLGDVASWDGSTLTEIPLADPEGDGNPLTVSFPVVAADPLRQTVLLVDGVPQEVEQFQTWELSLVEERAQVACRFDFGSAGAEAGSALERMVISVQAGAGTTTVPRDTDLLLWRDGSWQTLQVCAAADCPPGTLGPAQLEVDDPVEIARDLRDLDLIGFAVTAAVDAGFDPVRLANPQLTISYQLP